MKKHHISKLALALIMGLSANAAISQTAPAAAPTASAEARFDLMHVGDIENALWSIWRQNKSFKIAAPTGTQFPHRVALQLKGVTTMEALRELGRLGRDKVNVIVEGDAVKVVRLEYLSDGRVLSVPGTPGKAQSQYGYQPLDSYVAAGANGGAANAAPGVTTASPGQAGGSNGGGAGRGGSSSAGSSAPGGSGSTQVAAAQQPERVELSAGARKMFNDMGNFLNKEEAADIAAGRETRSQRYDREQREIALRQQDDAKKWAAQRQAEVDRMVARAREEQRIADQRAAEKLTRPGKISGKKGQEEFEIGETYAPPNFEYSFKGNLPDAMDHLKERYPKLQMLPVEGSPQPIVINLNMDRTDGPGALRAIAEQVAASGKAAMTIVGPKVRISYKANDKYGDDATAEAKRVQSGKAARPVVAGNGMVQYPFGATHPEVVCAPLRACTVTLQAGESVKQIVLGDTARWVSTVVTSGEGAGSTQLVVVKPMDKGLTTNLVVTTTRRTYFLNMRSSEVDFVSTIGFYYPNEIVQDWSDQAAEAKRQAEADDKRKISDLPIVNVDQLNFNYDVKGDTSVSWTPVRVFDDGVRVYLKMPPEMKSSEAPSFVLLDDKGNSELVNFRVKGDHYIVDKIFQRGALILGVGDDQKKVEIVRKGKNRGLFGIFGG